MSRTGSNRAADMTNLSLPDDPPDTIIRWLEARASALDLPTATAVRDRAAAYLGADPATAARLAKALLARVRRTRAESTPEIRAVAWRARAEAMLFLGKLNESCSAYEAAAREAKAGRADGLLGQILVGWVAALGFRGQTAASLRVATRARKILERVGDEAYLGRLYINLGNTAYHEERFGAAADWYDRASKLVRDERNLVTVLANRAVACMNLGRIAEAATLSRRAASLARELGLDRFWAVSQLTLAYIQRLRGDYNDALQLLENAERECERLGVRDLVAANVRARAEIYLDLAMAPEAFELGSRAQGLFREAGMDLDAELARLVEIESRLMQGRPAEAIELLRATSSYFLRQRMEHRSATNRLLLARAFLSLDDPRSAASAVQRALRTLRKRGMTRSTTEALRLLAIARLQQSRLRQAHEALDEALSSRAPLSAGETSVLWALAGRVSQAGGGLAEAARRYRKAIRYVELQRTLIPGAEFRARAFEHQVAVYHDLIAALVSEGHPTAEDLLELTEAARGRSHRDRSTAARGVASKTLNERRAKLGALTRRLEDAEYSEKRTDPVEERALMREIRSLESEISDELRRRDTRASKRKPVGAFRRVAARLPSRAAIVTYFVAKERVLAIVIRRGEASWHVLPAGAAVIQGQVDDLRFQIDTMAMTSVHANVNLAFMRRAAESSLAELHSSLFRPILSYLEDADLLAIVPHAFTHQVPFECLYDGAYVGDRWHVVRLPTADAFGRPRASGRPAQILVAGTLHNSPPFVERELRSVASHFPKPGVQLLMDAPTKQVLGALSEADVIHLSSHGSFRDDNPLFSRLSTADGGIFVADLMGMRLRARLAVLSACNSGQTFVGRGDDLSGVAHAFLASGVKQLVASHWRVHDEATHALMNEFYAQYVKDPDAVRALRAARSVVREKWDHPFYWGSFTVHGMGG